MSGGVRLPQRLAAAVLGLAVITLAACRDEQTNAPVEVLRATALEFSVHAEGQLKAVEATPLGVPGQNWSRRQLAWMLADGSPVAANQVVARFTAADAELELNKALLDLQRNALSRAAKEQELALGLGRVETDLAQVQAALGIAQTYARADFAALARNTVLDAVQDEQFLGEKKSVLRWRQGQSQQRGRAELDLVEAQRASVDLQAKQRRDELDALELRAPHAGVFVLVADWSGEKPKVGEDFWAGQDFASLPDTRHLQVELNLPQAEAQSLAVGQRVRLHPAGRPEQMVESTLSWVASAARPLGRQSPVKYLSAKSEVPAAAVKRFGWVPGQAFVGQIVVLASRSVLSVPNLAIDSANGEAIVRVQSGARIEPRKVTLGVRGPARSEVKAGLRAGDRVLLLPAADPASSAPDAAAATGEGKPT